MQILIGEYIVIIIAQNSLAPEVDFIFTLDTGKT